MNSGGDKAKKQRPKMIAPYKPDPGMDTEDGKRSSAHIPQEFFIENDRKPEAVPEVYKKRSPYPGGPKRVNVARFHEQKYHDLEVEHIWKKTWQMVCREDDLPEVGDNMLYQIADLEYIVVRTAEDEFNAYPNACPHRGRRICEHDGKKATHFRCPFHGWSWGIDGKMKDLTCEWDFPGVRQEEGDLTKVQTAPGPASCSSTPIPMPKSFEDYAGKEMIAHYERSKLQDRYKMLHVGKVVKMQLEADAGSFSGSLSLHCHAPPAAAFWRRSGGSPLRRFRQLGPAWAISTPARIKRRSAA